MKKDIENLLIKRLEESLTAEEELLVRKWLKEDIKNQQEFDDFTAIWISGKALYNPHKINTDEQWSKLLEKQRIRQAAKNKSKFLVSNRMVMSMAASVALLVALGIAFLYHNYTAEDQALGQDLPEFAPYSEHGAIILSNGASIDLKESSGEIVYNGNEGKIFFKDKELFPDKGPTAQTTEAVVEYNQITVPKGHAYQITLTDGTKVWLNSFSRFIYPLNFTGKERLVKLEGEGYFEVAPNAGQPFIVKTSHVDIRVLGTKFNVFCYANDDIIETTLVEGSVSINPNAKANKTKPLVLAPNQKAGFNKSISSIQVTKNIDTEYYTAWKDGYFKYYNEPFIKIVSQLERNYGIKVDYNPNDFENLNITGKLQRQESTEDLFKALSILIPIEYEIYEETLITLNKKK
ncbi:MAG: DUF4974 domain-containing protein [Bacteroidales bacterium]|nr:DUF4974 domain-containing protein [Bacteroidales bacterium]